MLSPCTSDCVCLVFSVSKLVPFALDATTEVAKRLVRIVLAVSCEPLADSSEAVLHLDRLSSIKVSAHLMSMERYTSVASIST